MNEWIVQISAGLGPIEVRQFVGRLAPRITEDLLQRGFSALGEIVYGPAACPKTVQLHVSGDPGRADDLLGTYVLVNRSPNRNRKDRKRWFVGVELFAAEALQPEVGVDEGEIEFSTARAGGPGGQHVNKTHSAVRAVHLPSRISVRVTSERSQHANKKEAIRLIQRAHGERWNQCCQHAAGEQRFHHHQMTRGNAIRSFRLDRRGRLVEVRQQ